MQKINEAAIVQNQHIAGLKVLISWLLYITVYSEDIKFSNNNINELTMAAWRPLYNFQNEHKKGPDFKHACKDLYSKETIVLLLLMWVIYKSFL